MKECINCKKNVRDNDIYCRYCGCLQKGNGHYVLLDVMIIFIIICIIGLIILFISSYLVKS